MENIDKWLTEMKARANAAAAKCREKGGSPDYARLKADPERYEKWKEDRKGDIRKRREENAWWFEACRGKRAAYWRECRAMEHRFAHIFKGME